MDIIFEVIVEFFAEMFCEGFLSASTEIVPYDKLPREKRGKYKFIVVVVLPTPPFWLAKDKTFVLISPYLHA